MGFLLMIGFVLLLVVISAIFKEDSGLTEHQEYTEENMSPMVELLMYDDFMEDGDLDIF